GHGPREGVHPRVLGYRREVTFVLARGRFLVYSCRLRALGLSVASRGKDSSREGSVRSASSRGSRGGCRAAPARVVRERSVLAVAPLAHAQAAAAAPLPAVFSRRIARRAACRRRRSPTPNRRQTR